MTELKIPMCFAHPHRPSVTRINGLWVCSECSEAAAPLRPGISPSSPSGASHLERWLKRAEESEPMEVNVSHADWLALINEIYHADYPMLTTSRCLVDAREPTAIRFYARQGPAFVVKRMS